MAKINSPSLRNLIQGDLVFFARVMAQARGLREKLDPADFRSFEWNRG